MNTARQTLLLFIIIVIEGYIVLSTELLAIRQTIPYVGSGTDTVSIIIAAVLMPLAFGYQSGGQFKPHKLFGRYITVRQKLILNILIAATILLPGMSYEFIQWFFKWMPTIGIDDRLMQIAIYSALFLVLPVYLLGQTVPLITNFFSKERLSRITGKILCYSTVGSFLGATFSTLVLMSTLGVHHTVSLNFVFMAVLVIMLHKKTLSPEVIYSVILAILAINFNSDKVMEKFHIVKNNQYNVIQAGTTSSGNRLMFLNGNHSSKYNDRGEKYAYIEFAERVTLDPIANISPPKEVLVIGAGAFTYGHNDKTNQFTYVDIDKDLLAVAEEYILQEPIGENKTFIPKPARAYLNATEKQFDLIFLDAYLGAVTMPEHLATKDFFTQVKSHLKEDGILITNFILSPHFNNDFSRNMDETFRSVFPYYSRHVVGEYYKLWDESETAFANVSYIYRHKSNVPEAKIYTDNKNTVFYDKPKKMVP